ncbi:SapC family protein [Microbulbifer sp. GL-2]|uniref:SapC family protein n=1 Tax=Microbulbifer sp. GL-2 TaxID=2591606 RepID=UPI00116463BB|nr:SapC family protein [Microbulbifer sp. GL-2]BBM02613.1 hypothetical protein GL2_26870 [Microbulbifer sp. GL-2]
MASIVVVDNERHRDIRVLCQPKLCPQDGLGYIQVFPSELDSVHKEYPVFIKKNHDTGEFLLVALLSLDPDKNINLKNGRWDSKYIPMMARRGPFIIGRSGDSLNLCVDLEDRRVGREGERLFSQDGEPLELANKAARLLSFIHQGYQENENFFKVLDAESLIESLAVESFQGVSGSSLKGLYSINPNKLRKLSGCSLERLNSAGFLQRAYFLASSATNIGSLFNNTNCSEKVWVATEEKIS